MDNGYKRFETNNSQLKSNIRSFKNVNSICITRTTFKSRSYILGIQVIRKLIEALRQQQSQASTSKQVRREINESNKDALIESPKRNIKKFEDDNKQLREQLKVAYAEVYKES